MAYYHGLNDGGSGTDHRLGTNAHSARQSRTRCDVNMGRDVAVMVNAGARINDGVFSNPGAGLNYGAGHYLCAFRYITFPGDHRRGMDNCTERIALGAELFEDHPPLARIIRAADSVDQQNIGCTPLFDQLIIPQNTNAEDRLTMERFIGIQNSGDRRPGFDKRGYYNDGVPTGAKDKSGFHRSIFSFILKSRTAGVFRKSQ